MYVSQVLTFEFSGLTFLVLISGSVVTNRFHHSILLTCGDKTDLHAVL